MLHKAVFRGLSHRITPITRIAILKAPHSTISFGHSRAVFRRHVRSDDDGGRHIEATLERRASVRNHRFPAQHLGNLSAPTFYFAGPPKTVVGVSNAVEAGVDPTRVQSEEFDGY